jgi:hypothetical protein
MLHMSCQMQEMHKGKLNICYKGAPTHPTQEIKHAPISPANEWKLLDLGVWWKYRLVGHVWVHGSRLSSLFLRCLSENDTSLLRSWFWNEALGFLQHYGTSVITLKWDMGILLTKITHSVCDLNVLRATTSCGNVLCLGSGLSSTRLFAGTPRHQRRSQKLASPRSGLPIQPTLGKIRVWKPWSAKEEDAEYQRPKSGVWRKYLNMRLTACRCEVLGEAWKRAHRHTENWMSSLVAVK